MFRYFSTFTTGFKEVIKEALLHTLKGTQIELLEDGLVLYKTNASIEQIQRLRFLNNSFVVIKYFKGLGQTPTKQMIKGVLNDPNLQNTIGRIAPKRRTTFRVIIKEDRIIAIDKNILGKLEHKISQVNQLVVNRTLPQTEFWFLTRREGFGLFGMRITKRPNYEKTLEKGELYPEFANILCLISEPSQNDVFLDPFSGWGSIPLQRVLSFPYKQVFAGDNDPKLVDKLRNKTRKLQNRIILGRWDGLSLTTFNNNSVSKIITDPPWGLHSGKELNLPKFYLDMLNGFHRVLQVNGFAVILVAKKELFEEVLANLTNKFVLIVKYDTLVSGQKAAVYKLRKL